MLIEPNGRRPTHVLGDWTFHTAAAELRRGAERRRLENRAARVLELLCERRGEVVSAEELVDQIWGGRALSQNSVAVVVGDLRRALGDDARHPRYIETVAKRGYRLVAVPAVASPAPVRDQRLVWGAAVIAVVLLAAGAVAWNRAGSPAPAPVLVLVEEVINDTGDPVHDPVARSVTEVILSELSTADGIRVVRRASGDVDATLSGRLVIWTGQPALGMSATEPTSGEVMWAGMAGGPEPDLPEQIHREIAIFAAQLAAKHPPDAP